MSTYQVSVKVKTPDGVKTVSVKRTYATKEAATKAGERLLADVKASGLTPVGTFILRNASGKEVRPYLSKEEYNDLYHFISTDVRMSYANNYEEYRNKVPILSKRCDTLDQARKGALAKSKEIWNHNLYFGRSHNISIEVYKGQKYLGFVTYNILKGKDPMFKGYEGTWSPAEHPKDEQLLKKDGSTL